MKKYIIAISIIICLLTGCSNKKDVDFPITKDNQIDPNYVIINNEIIKLDENKKTESIEIDNKNNEYIDIKLSEIYNDARWIYMNDYLDIKSFIRYENLETKNDKQNKSKGLNNHIVRYEIYPNTDGDLKIIEFNKVTIPSLYKNSYDEKDLYKNIKLIIKVNK